MTLFDLPGMPPDMTAEEYARLAEELPDPVIASLMSVRQDYGDAPDSPLAQAVELDPIYRERAHLRYLSDRLTKAVEDVEAGQSRYLKVSMPPRSGKSLLTSVYLPTWLIRTHSDWKIGLVSHNPTLAVSWGRQVRRIIEEHGPAWGVAIAKDSGAASDWETTTSGTVTSRSAPGQSLTGLGFKVMLLDDLVKDFAAAHSQTQRDALWDWWVANAFTRLEAPFLAVAVGTRWHEDDYLARLTSDEYEGDPSVWEDIVFPAVATEESVDPVSRVDILGRSPGDPLISPLMDETPDEATRRWAEIREAVGEYNWAALFQQDPTPAKGDIFDVARLRFWTVTPDRATPDGRVTHLDPNELTAATWLDSWDCAFKATDTSDWVVGQRWARRGPDRFLIAQARGRWAFTTTLHRIKAWSSGVDGPDNPYGHLSHKRLIEDKANGPAILDSLKQEVAGLKPIDPKTSKEARARAVTPEIESGNVYLPHPDDPGNGWVLDLISEFRNFPHGAHDDQVDAATQALTELRGAGRGMLSLPGGRQQVRLDRSRTAAAHTDRRRLR